MLLTMKARTEAARASAYCTAGCMDRAAARPTPRARPQSRARVELLTPMAKAWCTDVGVEVASLGIQVHGGMGYIEETGAAQHSTRRPHRADLRGHQRHPGRRSDRPQAVSRQGGECGSPDPRHESGPGGARSRQRHRPIRDRVCATGRTEGVRGGYFLDAGALRWRPARGCCRGCSLPEAHWHAHRWVANGARRADRPRSCWRPARRMPRSCGPRSPRPASTPSMCSPRRKHTVRKLRWAPARRWRWRKRCSSQRSTLRVVIG